MYICNQSANAYVPSSSKALQSTCFLRKARRLPRRLKVLRGYPLNPTLVVTFVPATTQTIHWQDCERELISFHCLNLLTFPYVGSVTGKSVCWVWGQWYSWNPLHYTPKCLSYRLDQRYQPILTKNSFTPYYPKLFVIILNVVPNRKYHTIHISRKWLSWSSDDSPLEQLVQCICLHILSARSMC